MKQSAIGIFCVLLAAVVLSGCGGSHKQEGERETNSTGAGTATVANKLSSNEGDAYLKNVCSLYAPWKQVRVPVSVKINSPKSFSISGTAEMVHGSSVFMSLKFFGMEVVWLYVNSDEVTVVDKMNKRYISESTSRFLGGFDVSTSNLQDLLFGRPFVLGTDAIADVDTEGFVYTGDGVQGWSLQPKSNNELLEYGFWFEPQTVLNAAVVQYGGKGPVALLYGTPVDTPSGSMASQIGIKAKVGNTEVDATIFWNWQKAKWGDSFTSREPKVPDNYKKVDGATVLKSLTHI